MVHSYSKKKQLRKNEIRSPLTNRKISYKGLRLKAWVVFSNWIKKRDRYTCITCGKPGNEGGHFIHKDCLDFNEKAINTQCHYCNHYKSGNLAKYALYLEKKYGHGVLQELEQLAWQAHRFTKEELSEIIKKYSKPSESFKS